MLKISPGALGALADAHRNRQFPRICAMLSAAIAGQAGSELGLPPAMARDHCRITALVSAAEAAGLDGEKDIVTYGLLNAGDHPRLPDEIAEWIGAVVVDQASSWPEKLDAIYALLPEPQASLLFPAD